MFVCIWMHAVTPYALENWSLKILKVWHDKGPSLSRAKSAFMRINFCTFKWKILACLGALNAHV